MTTRLVWQYEIIKELAHSYCWSNIHDGPIKHELAILRQFWNKAFIEWICVSQLNYSCWFILKENFLIGCLLLKCISQTLRSIVLWQTMHINSSPLLFRRMLIRIMTVYRGNHKYSIKVLAVCLSVMKRAFHKIVGCQTAIDRSNSTTNHIWSKISIYSMYVIRYLANFRDSS